MNASMRIKHLLIVTFSTLSGCSFFEGSVQTCNEPQEYQESISVPALIVPDSLKELQNRSIFNIPDVLKTKSFNQISNNTPKISNNKTSSNKTINKIENIEDDELSELLELIDQTIEYRTLREYNLAYDSSVIDSDVEESLGPCAEDPPNYFTEGVMPRSMPSQASSKSSNRSNKAKKEKSRRQKRKEARQQRKTDQQSEAATAEDTSSENAAEATATEAGKGDKLWKAISGIAAGLYTGGSSEYGGLAGGQSVVPPEPTKPGDDEIIDETDPTAVADKVRNLALLDPALNDEQRIFIQNMTDEQILEMVGVIMNQTQNQNTDESTPANGDTRVEAGESVMEEEKSRWQTRREARQQRRAEKQSQEEAREQAAEDRLKREEEARRKAAERKAEEQR
jgi:hypothetical protein